MRRNSMGRAGPPRGIRSWPGMTTRANARDDTQQAHLLIQEKATHPEGDVPEVRMGRTAREDPSPAVERDTDTSAWKPQGGENGLDYLVPIPGYESDDQGAL